MNRCGSSENNRLSGRAYCPACQEFVEFATVVEEMTGMGYPMMQAVCSKCGTNAVFAPYTAANGRAYNEKLRRKNHLVPAYIVQALVEECGGVEEAAAACGIGVEHYESMLSGVTPFPDDSNRIMSVWENMLKDYAGKIGSPAVRVNSQE